MVGRPNAGKSSMVNRFLGAERVIVSEMAGTTRDSIDTRLEFEGRAIILIDTAGLKRRSRLGGSVEFYAQLRTERAAERADVAIVVCDSAEGLVADDLRAAELAMRSGCATIVALNKWDIGETDLEDARARLEKRLRLRPRVVAASAKTGRNIETLLREAVRLADARAERIPTPELNRFVADVTARRSPPSKNGRRLRLYYAAQVGTSPPRFAVQVNDRRLVSRDWAYFFENQMRERYGMQGVPARDRLRAPQAARALRARGEGITLGWHGCLVQDSRRGRDPRTDSLPAQRRLEAVGGFGERGWANQGQGNAGHRSPSARGCGAAPGGSATSWATPSTSSGAASRGSGAAWSPSGTGCELSGSASR